MLKKHKHKKHASKSVRSKKESMAKHEAKESKLFKKMGHELHELEKTQPHKKHHSKKKDPKRKKKESAHQKAKVRVVMEEFKRGELPIGRSKKKVHNPKQAIAIALHEAGVARKKKK